MVKWALNKNVFLLYLQGQDASGFILWAKITLSLPFSWLCAYARETNKANVNRFCSTQHKTQQTNAPAADGESTLHDIGLIEEDLPPILEELVL